MDELQNKIQELSNEIKELRINSTKDIADLQNRFDSKNLSSIDRYTDNETKDSLERIISERIFDIVWNDFYYYSSTFESIDRYLTLGTGASEIVNADGLYLATDGTGTNEAGLLLVVSSDLISTSRIARFRVSNKVSSITNVNWAALTLEDSLGTSYVGFWMKSGTIYGATSKAGTETLVSLGSYSADTFYKLELYFTPAKVTFYVDGIEKGVSTTNIPTTTPTKLFDIGIGETSASARNSTTSYFEFIQKKN